MNTPQTHWFIPLTICLILVLATANLLLGHEDNSDTPQRPPNVIFFLADDLGVECVGAYGGEAYRTPNLDRLAAEGMRFNHCYAGPACTPSRVALMTGKYNHRNYHNFSMLPRGERTFAHITKDAGYRTCIVSKWQLGSGWEGVRGSTPESAGFDESCMKAGNTYWNARIETNGTEQAIDKPYYGPDVCCDYAVDFMRRNADQPFFLYYAFNLPHWDFDATPDSDDLSSRKDDKNFPDMVTYTDKLVGRVVRELEELGLRENTLILFSGDNGTASSITSPFRGTMRRGGKGSRRMIDANVPLIANWPGRIKPGGVCDDLIDFSDIYPTIAEACGRGAKKPASTDAACCHKHSASRPNLESGYYPISRDAIAGTTRTPVFSGLATTTGSWITPASCSTLPRIRWKQRRFLPRTIPPTALACGRTSNPYSTDWAWTAAISGSLQARRVSRPHEEIAK